MSVTIKTNNTFRHLAYRYEVPEAILSSQFDYLDEDSGPDGFFKYRGYWYHTGDFMRIEHNDDLKGWHGYSSDSAFSGVLIKLSRDGESVICGTYYS